MSLSSSCWLPCLVVYDGKSNNTISVLHTPHLRPALNAHKSVDYEDKHLYTAAPHVHVYTHACTHASLHICMHANTYTHAHTHTHTHTRTHACTFMIYTQRGHGNTFILYSVLDSGRGIGCWKMTHYIDNVQSYKTLVDLLTSDSIGDLVFSIHVVNPSDLMSEAVVYFCRNDSAGQSGTPVLCITTYQFRKFTVASGLSLVTLEWREVVSSVNSQ